MAELSVQGTGGRASLRRVIDYPLVALLIAVGLYILAAGTGQNLGSSIPVHSAAAKMWVRNATIFAIVLLTYKLAIARLGASPRDDLTARRSLIYLGAGLLVGFLLMAAAVAAAAVAQVYNLVGEGDSSDLMHALITAAIMPAFMEELLFRGILFRWIEEFAGSWAALAITSALFGLIHIFNPQATWFSSFAIALEAGVMLGGAYMLTRSLWLPMGIHAAWNFAQGEVFGVPVSGTSVHGLLRSRLTGPEILSGGGFGLEATLFALLIATAAGVWFVWLAVRRGEVVQPSWRR
ncbi:MAG TPA: type II CAAX endopeptidase family protein [Sphingomicrobium sp.]